MPRSILYTDNARQGTDKINELYGIESGALADPWELTFSAAKRIRTLTVDEDIELALSSGEKFSECEEILYITGDGSHALTFPDEWVMRGDTFNFDKIHRAHFIWTGDYVIGVLTVLADVPDLTPPTLSSATLEDATDNRLDLVFNEAVNITTAGWSVSASGGAVTVDAVASGDGTTTPKLTLSRSVAGTETVTVSYDPGTGATANLSGTELETISGASVTNNVVTVLLHVPFTGASIDTSAGTVTNPDSANLTITQNNKLIFTRTTDNAVASSLTNFWRSTNTYGEGAFAALLNKDVGYSNSIVVMQYRVDSNNDATILVKDNDEITVRIRQSGSVVYTADVTVSISGRFKIVRLGHAYSFWRHNGSAWVQLGTTQTFNIGSVGNLQLSSSSAATDAASDAFSFDDVYITNRNYSAATP